MRRLAIALLASIAVIGSAAAADMPTKAPMYTKAPVIVPPYNWTGFYIGGNVGYSWGRQDVSLLPGGTTDSVRLDGVIGGGQLGYNWQFNQIVLGLEADIQASGQKGDGIDPAPINSTFLPTITFNDKLDWFGTVRGRLGFAQDRWLAYVTGGWAYGHGNLSGTATGFGAFSASTNYSGWTVGGGVEWAFMDKWSAKLEYLYIDFGDGPTIALAPPTTVVGGKMTDNIVRVGLNYKFF